MCALQKTYLCLTGWNTNKEVSKNQVLCVFSPTGQRENRPLDKFQLTFPLRTNYMYAKVKKSLPEMYALTVCMWLKSNASPGVGTPFSYAVPGQANELVLIEWGNNPMEILINDKVSLKEPSGYGSTLIFKCYLWANIYLTSLPLKQNIQKVAKLPFLINDGKWHHICVTWTTRDGVWEAFQDGVKRGSGENLAPYHPIKPQGLLILGQEQVITAAHICHRRSSIFQVYFSHFNLW